VRGTGGDEHTLDNPEVFAGYGDPQEPTTVLHKPYGLHFGIVINRDKPVGSADRGIADFMMESAVTTIMNLEDSVAVVDVEDKVLGWLGLMPGTQGADAAKSGRTFRRVLNIDDGLRRLALVVDQQKADDPLDSLLTGVGRTTLAFEASRRLILGGAQQPSGYSEPTLAGGHR
jgi:malate synthase